MTEYAIIVALIALGCIGGIKILGGQISAVFTKTADHLESGSSE